MNPVVHFEMPYEDKDRMISFYGKAFGWTANKLGPDMGDYVVVMTTEMDEHDRFPKEPGRINGGFYPKQDDPMSRCPSVVIAVDDIRDAMKKVEQAGGRVLGGGRTAGEPDDIPGVGLFCSVLDTEGNRVSMLQPSPSMSGPPA